MTASAPACARCHQEITGTLRRDGTATLCVPCYQIQVLGYAPGAADPPAAPGVVLSDRETREAARWERLHQQLRWLPVEWAAINALFTIAIGGLVWFLRRLFV